MSHKFISQVGYCILLEWRIHLIIYEAKRKEQKGALDKHTSQSCEHLELLNIVALKLLVKHN